MNGITVRAYSKAKDGGKKLSDHFLVREFACRDGSDPIFVCDELVQVLQAIRNHFGKPVVVSSGYRNPGYNKSVGGATYSQHLYGTAADIHISGVSPKEQAAFAESLLPNSGGIGVYSWGIHVDVRKVKARWTG